MTSCHLFVAPTLDINWYLSFSFLFGFFSLHKHEESSTNENYSNDVYVTLEITNMF